MGQSLIYEEFDSLGKEIGSSLFSTDIELLISRNPLSPNVTYHVAELDLPKSHSPVTMMPLLLAADGSTQQMLL
ncbi:hypothetical protein A7D21_32435 [Pseudomonas sp. AP19]|jgi:hypothetical protein|nr:hypothetical protein A7D21_32435 [Pseudomonas sp. AP19]